MKDAIFFVVVRFRSDFCFVFGVFCKSQAFLDESILESIFEDVSHFSSLNRVHLFFSEYLKNF